MQTYTDAKNQTFAMTYDALSRPLTRRDLVTSETTQESKTVWVWGQSVTLHNVGQLQGVSYDSSDGTYTEAHTYDGLARVSQRDISMPGQGTFSYNFGYDAATGLIDTLTYPVSTASSRLTVRYCYQYGRLQKVADGTCSGTAFWQANATNSRGQITNETLGNGITTQRTFDAVTGWVSTVRSGTAGSPASVQNESYLFDRVGNVTQRQNNRVGLTEDFYYDDLYRLDYSNLTNGSGTTQNLDMTYQDAFGNIQSKMEAGYTAPAVDQTIEWTAFNYPKRITATVLGGTQQIASFAYGPDRQRWRMVYESGSATETTLYIGSLMEKVTVGTASDYRHYIYAGGKVAAIFSRQSSGTNTLRYVFQDHQGSVASLLTGTSAVNESFTAYGNRRDANTWSNPPSSSDLQSMNGITRQGYTGHTALGTMGLNHMNGRVQDAITGTFLSPDPYVNQPGSSQGFNRYAYAHNNPLTFIDPSGFDIYCWSPPSSYGGTVIVNGIETVITNGPAEQCTFIGTTPGLPPAGPGGRGGGFNIPPPKIDMNEALREICETEVEAEMEKPESDLHRDLDLAGNILTPGELPLSPLAASWLADAAHRVPKEAGAYAMNPFPRYGDVNFVNRAGWQAFQRANGLFLGLSARGISGFGIVIDMLAADDSFDRGDNFQGQLDLASVGAGAAAFVHTPYGFTMWLGIKALKPIMIENAKYRCRGVFAESAPLRF